LSTEFCSEKPENARSQRAALEASKYDLA